MLCEEKGAHLRVAPIDDAGVVDLAEFERLLGPRTRIVSVSHVSNALGTVNPVKQMTELAHAAGAVVMIDGAQAVPHAAVDVQEIGCDFYAFSGHKVYGPSGRRRALRPGRPARGHAALAGRRRHDRLRHLREVDLGRDPRQVRGGDAEHRRGDRPRRGPRLGGGGRPRRHRRPRGRAPALRHRAPLRDSRAAPDRHRPAQGRGPVLRPRRGPPPRHRHHPRLRGGGGPHRAPLRPAGHGPLRRSGHRPGLARLLQHPGGPRRPGPGDPQGPGDVPGERAPGAVPGGHPRPLQEAPPLPRDAGGQPPRRRAQPPVRRPGHRLPAPRRAT